MPPATLQIFATAQVIADDAELVNLLDRQFDVTVDLAAATPLSFKNTRPFGMSNSVYVAPDGSVDFSFFEETSGSGAVHTGELQTRLRELGIAYQWGEQIYLDDEDYTWHHHYWQPGMTDERVTGEDGLPVCFDESDERISAAALRAAATFRFDPPVVTALA